MEEAFPNVNFIQYRNWTEAAQILANIHYPDIIITAELRDKAAEITAGMKGGLEKAKAVYSFVNDLVKDDAGPDEAIDVLLEARGNRFSLFLALLEAAGVGHDILRCGLREGYRPVPDDWSKVSLNLFPQALVRLDRGTLVSMSSRLTAFGEIPPYLFGAQAMKVTGVPERIETLPGGDPLAHRTFDITLDARVDGDDALITGTVVFPGFGRTGLQEQLQKIDTLRRRQLFEYGLMREIYPGARVNDLEITGIDEPGGRPAFRFELSAKGFVFPAADGKACKLLPKQSLLTRQFIRKPSRVFPMVRRGYSSYRMEMNVDLGENLRLERLPAGLVEKGFFLNYSLLTRRTAAGFRVERVLELLPADVAPHEYPGLIEMLTAIDEREVVPVTLAARKE